MVFCLFKKNRFPFYSESLQADFDTLVAVPSMQRNLRSLALAVAVGAAVLLQGPVGCGKTALVEHLATLTGRSRAPHLLKVQLGDQTDSKVSNIKIMVQVSIIKSSNCYISIEKIDLEILYCTGNYIIGTYNPYTKCYMGFYFMRPPSPMGALLWNRTIECVPL